MNPVRPRISVVIPTFKRPELLRTTLESMVHQTLDDVVVLVVDDSVEEEARPVVESFDEKRIPIRYLRNPGKGGNAARNHGIRKATSDLIAFCDDDDTFMPEKLQEQVDLLNTQSLDAVYCYTKRVRESNGEKVWSEVHRTPIYTGKLQTQMLLAYNFIGTQTLLCKKSKLVDIGGFDESLRRMQDWDIAIRLSRVCRMGRVSRPLVRICIHDGERISTLSWDLAEPIYRKHRCLARNPMVVMLVLAHHLRHPNWRKLRAYFRGVWLPLRDGRK